MWKNLEFKLKQVIQVIFSTFNLRLIRLSNFNRLLGIEAQLHETEAKLFQIELEDQRAREYTQLNPIKIPQVDQAFFIKVKVDYPDVFQPNPPDYIYEHVQKKIDYNRADIEKNISIILPLMYGERIEKITTSKQTSHDPYWNNGMFEKDDARAVYAMTACLKPRRIIEVGSGNSTKFFRKAISDYKLDCELICIDPEPRAEVSSVANKIIFKSVKDVPKELFQDLNDGDILFWDGSHIVFNGTDTTYFYMDILPLITKNVFVHIHDINLPKEYEPGYSAHYYSEQYMLGTLLINSTEWKPLIPIYWLKANGYIKYGGCSFWIARQHLSFLNLEKSF